MISVAHAQTASQQGGGYSSLIMIVAIFAIFYFLMIRPQQKKQKQLKLMLSALKVGDEVVSAGGILGKITSIDDQYISLEIANNTQMKILRTSIINILPKGSI